MQNSFDDIDSFYSHPLFQGYFETSCRSLIIKAEAPLFTIIAVSNQYLSKIYKHREEVLYAPFFTVFPDSDRDASQQERVLASFTKVIDTKMADILPVLIYELNNPGTGKKELHYWSIVNEPMTGGNGEVLYIICTVANTVADIQDEKALEKANRQKADLSLPYQQNELLTAYNTEQKRLREELKRAYEREQILVEELSASNEKTLVFNEQLYAGKEQLQVMYDTLLQTHIKLTVAEERVRLSTEAADIGTFAIELVGGKFNVSQRTCEIFGITPCNELSLDDFVVQMDDADRDRVAASINRTIALANSQYYEEYGVIRKNDGEKRWVRALGNTRTLGEDQMPIFAGVVIDITEQKADEQRRNSFVEAIASELRVPLSSFSRALQSLQIKTGSQDQLTLDILEKAKGEVSQMNDIIDGLRNAFFIQKKSS